MNRLHWLLPGLGIKRWLLVLGAGALALVVGLLYVVMLIWPVFYSRLQEVNALGRLLLGIVFLVGGAVLSYWGIKRGMRALRVAIRCGQPPDLPSYLRQWHRAERGPRLVVIGGGSGLSTLLRGLKLYSSHLTAIVTVSDEGGSSGRLRRDLGMLPPGDIRNCLLALADTEPVMERLFQHRFGQGTELAGHSFGNLFIAAMTEMSGDFEQAVRLFSQVLAVRGRVLPATLQDVRIRAHYFDGSLVTGESQVSAVGKPIRKIELDPPGPPALPEAMKAIEKAEAVIIGPGSLYTSIIPNLLVTGLVEALRETVAPVAYVCNVMTQPGETRGYGAADHLKAVMEVTGPGVIDIMLMNDQIIPSDRLLDYTEQGAQPVPADVKGVKEQGVHPVVAPLLNDSGLVRHDAEKLAQTMLYTLSCGREGQWWTRLQDRWDHIGGTRNES